MGKYNSEGLDFRFLALAFAFVVGSLWDWFSNHPSEAHWLGVGAAFVLLATNLGVSNTEDRVKRIEAKLDDALDKLENMRPRSTVS
jgi:hypothetical protein